MTVGTAILVIRLQGYNPIGFGTLFGQDVILFSTRAEAEEVKEKLSSELEGSQAECYGREDFSVFAATDENSSCLIHEPAKSRINTIEDLAALPTGTEIIRLLQGEEKRFSMLQSGIPYLEKRAIILDFSASNVQVIGTKEFRQARWFLRENHNVKELGFHIIEQLQEMKSEYISKIDSQIEAVRKFFV